MLTLCYFNILILQYIKNIKNIKNISYENK